MYRYSLIFRDLGIFDFRHRLSLSHRNQTHPDLHLWCQPWRPADKPIKKEELGSDEGLGSLANGGRGKDAQHRAQSTSSSSSMSSSASSSSSSPLPSPFQDAFISYISSEHCYQKPRALVVEKRGGSYMDGDLHACDPQRPSAKQYADQASMDRALMFTGGPLKPASLPTPCIRQNLLELTPF